jgi:uncharacterized phage protein gp47/JayE
MALTEHGYELPTLEEIYTDIAARQKKVFPDINLDPATPDGQLLGLLAEAIHQAYEVGAGIYTGMDPRGASGIMLDRVASLSGIYRKKAMRSRVNLTFSGTDGTTIPERTRVQDNNTPPRVFETETTASISGGSVNILAHAIEPGPMTIPADTVTELVNPIPGVTSVTNPTAGQSGRNEETDAELRLRREASLAQRGQALVDSVYAAIYQVEEVEGVAVYENKESSDDSNGVPGHSIYCIVEGGDPAEIADAIMRNKSLGCGLHGTESVEWYDLQGFGHTVRFSRPTQVEIWIQVTVASPAFGPDVEEAVKTAIIEYIQDIRVRQAECPIGGVGIGDDIQAATFYPALSGTPDYTPITILVGKTDPGDSDVVTIGIDEIGAFDAARITVMEHGATP